MQIFQKQSDSFLGVDIGAGGFKLVELKNTKGRPQLWTYGLANQELDIHIEAQDSAVSAEVPDVLSQGNAAAKKNMDEAISSLSTDERIVQYGETLKALIKQAGVTSRKVTASLPVSYVFHALVTLPFVEPKELTHHIEAKIKKMLPQDIEEMQVVYQKVPNGDEKAKYFTYLVTAAPKQLVAFYTSIFTHAGLELQELETEAFALTRALVGNDTGVSMIVDIGTFRTNFLIVDKGLPMTQRSLQIGGKVIDEMFSHKLGINKESAKQIKHDLSIRESSAFEEDFYARIVVPMIKEIEYNFDLFFRQAGNEGKRPEKILLTGGSSLFPIFAKYLEEHFSMRVFLADPWARVVYQQGLKKTLDNIGPRMGVAVGLAMRNIV